jgi:hypothetical protein
MRRSAVCPGVALILGCQSFSADKDPGALADARAITDRSKQSLPLPPAARKREIANPS